MAFFADAITKTSLQDVQTAEKLSALTKKNRLLIHGLGARSGSTLEVHECMLRKPIANEKTISAALHMSPTTVNSCLELLQQLNIVSEITGEKRNRLFAYEQYIDIMNEEIE